MVQPYNNQGSYSNENFPSSVQTQVVGITPGGSSTNVGFYIDANGNNIGFVDQGGTFTAVSDPLTPAGTPATPSVNQLLGVNDNGVAAGFYVDGNNNAQGFLYNIGTKAFTPITLPISFNAVSTTVTGINDSGVITGFYTDAGGATHGFIDNGTFTSFDDPNGTNTMFLGINASDQVVGSYLNGSGVTDGLLFNSMTDSFQTVGDPLASSTAAFGVTGTTINGINNANDLVGFYSDGTNVDGFLATPTPEPATFGLLLIGGGLMISRHRRNKNARR
ncbi:MAG: PEP-CTERM sorting domain-containing protein [Bryobacterales bacterium]|nr:PEP-CTERM sorting domain-containing protein [Bryobacterales bacterium]